jgi:aspartate aminotransferase, cytoplasmic
VETYNYYDAAQGIVDFDSHLSAIRGAPEGSLFILQGCCHNPTGADFTKEQWQILAQEIKAKKHFPFFDIAYQGLGDSMDDDSYGVRFFAEAGFEMAVCQSFSKNFALYGERCGVLHVVTNDKTSAANVKDQLRSLIRWEFSSSPAYGSRLVSIVAEDGTLTRNW